MKAYQDHSWEGALYDADKFLNLQLISRLLLIRIHAGISKINILALFDAEGG